MALSDIMSDRAKLLRLFQIAFWASLVFLAIGYAIIIMDLLG
ncbi:MAG: hypothetical protein AB7S97_00695 [Thermoplasmata archaeon]